MVATALRSVFTQKCSTCLEEHWDQVGAILAGKFSRAAALLVAARKDVLAFWSHPPRQWRKLWSTNLLERMNEAIERQSRPIGILLNNAAITRLVGAVLLVQDEHRQLALQAGPSQESSGMNLLRSHFRPCEITA